MDVVVDTSVLIAVIANESEKPQLIRLTMGVNLLTPLSCHWEVGNAFSAMLKRKRITLSQARQALAVYQQIPVRFIEVDLEQAVELAAHFGIYAYDAYIIACALNQKCALLSLDRGLIRAAKATGLTVWEVNR